MARDFIKKTDSIMGICQFFLALALRIDKPYYPSLTNSPSTLDGVA